MIELYKNLYTGQHHHVQYGIPELQGKVPFLQEYIDSTSDSKVGKATQTICDKLFTQGKTKREGRSEYFRAITEIYQVNEKEILFFKIISKIVSDRAMSRCKLLEELAKLPKKQLEETLVLMKVTGY